jgi:hypothetical protein
LIWIKNLLFSETIKRFFKGNKKNKGIKKSYFMKSYKSFLITESISNLKFLLEAKLTSSYEFVDKLEILRNKSIVARVIYDNIIKQEKDYDDKDLKHNWIDVTDKDDTVSFLPELKAKEDQSASDLFSNKKRGEIKIGRLVRSILKLIGNNNINDKEIEKFVNMYKATFKDEEEFRIVSGDDIPYWYNYENYYEDYGQGSLSGSCMRDVEPEFFDIYKKSPSCQMLILVKKDLEGVEKLIGRALVWRPKVKPSNITYFMDRIYTLKESDVDKFKNYADENGWLRKRYNDSSIHNGKLFINGQEKESTRLIVNVSDDCEYYPYCDTFHFMNSDQDELSNIGYIDGWTLFSTEGEKERCGDCNGEGVLTCQRCDDTGEISCGACRGNGKLKCSECDGNGELECHMCEGYGEYDCDKCNGIGDMDCEVCDGSVEFDGEECGECEGSGGVSCDKCDRGKLPCRKCDESGNTRCNDCGGTSKIDCDSCDGDCTITCPSCGGEPKLCEYCIDI